METIHNLLQRQIKRHFGDDFSIPDDWRGFINAVSDAYGEFDIDREMLERSLDLSSQELLQANSEMRAVFQAIPDLVFRLNHDGVILDIKAGETSDLMIERQHLLGKRIQDTPLKSVAHQFSEALRQVVRENVCANIEYSAVLQGLESFYEARLMPMPNSQIVVIIRNITERKQSLRLLGAAVEQSTESIVITDAELDLPGPRILFVNPAFTKMSGYTAEEVMGKTPRILQGPRSDRAVLNRLRQNLSEGKAFEGETVNYRKDGTEFYVEWQVSPIRNSVGVITHFVGIQRDVTKRKQAEAALRESENQFHTLARVSPAGIFRTEANGGCNYMNEKLCRITGMTVEEALGTGWTQGIHPEDRERVYTEWQKCVHEKSLFRMQYRFIHKDGTVIWSIGEADAILDADGNIAGYVGTITDITELKQVEANLAHERDLLRTLLDNSLDHIYFKDTKSRFIKVGIAHAKRFGATSPDDMVGKTDFDYFTDAHARPAFEDEQEIIRTGCPMIDKVEREMWNDGRAESWVITSKMPFRNQAGDIIGTFGISKDITALKLAEAALAYERDLLNVLLDNIPDAIYFKDLQSCFVRVSRSKLEKCRAIELARHHAVHSAGENENPPLYLTSTERYAEHLTETTDFDFFSEPKAREFYEEEQEVIRTGTPLISKISHTTVEDGKDAWYITSRLPWRDRDGKIIGTFGVSKDITDIKHAQNALHRLHEEHELILNSVGEGVHSIDSSGKITFENPAAMALFGHTSAELIGKPAHETMHHTRSDGSPYPVNECPVHATLQDGKVRHVTDEVFWRKDGTSFPVEYTSTPVRNEHGKIIGTTVVFSDITERKRIEAQLFQSQKLETVGKLAGGIAHEFNSIMTTIIGHSELLLSDLPLGDPLCKNASEIRHAANRAASLTRQLLAYGRKQILRPEILDLNAVLAGMETTLRHLAGPSIAVSIIPAVGLKTVKADSGQVEQVIMNIVMNAIDAMPRGGKLTLETSNLSFDQDRASQVPELKAGDYIMLVITDTGPGMTKEMKARLFEPFFTTKDIGAGTGLGLATCYGIVKQSGGHISVYSEPGHGTTFKIFLPQNVARSGILTTFSTTSDLPRGIETILLVEDDSMLREMSASVLKRLGYTVLAAANGVEALTLIQKPDTGYIDLLFTDVVMPQMNGKELSTRVRALYPEIRILFASAYTENAIVHQGILDPDVILLQKPFTPSTLAQKIRELLDCGKVSNKC